MALKFLQVLLIHILTDFQNAGIIFEKRPKIPKSIVGSIYDLLLTPSV